MKLNVNKWNFSLIWMWFLHINTIKITTATMYLFIEKCILMNVYWRVSFINKREMSYTYNSQNKTDIRKLPKQAVDFHSFLSLIFGFIFFFSIFTPLSLYKPKVICQCKFCASNTVHATFNSVHVTGCTVCQNQFYKSSIK